MLKINHNKLPTVRYVGFVNYKRPWKHFKRISDECIIYFIISGDLYINVYNQDIHLQENDFLIILPNTPHVGYKSASCSYYFIHLDSLDAEEMNEENTSLIYDQLQKYWFGVSVWHSIEEKHRFVYLPRYLTIKGVDQLNKIYHFFNESIQLISQKPLYYKINIAVYILQIFIEASIDYNNYIFESFDKKSTIRYDSIRELVRYLNDHYNESISSSDIANLTNLHYDYVNRIFKKCTHYTIFQYVTKLRIDHAKYLLQNQELNCYEIGERVGYSNPYYFSKIFKNTVGMSLTDYKKKLINSSGISHSP